MVDRKAGIAETLEMLLLDSVKTVEIDPTKGPVA
jgi:hypothetical protein